MHQFLLIYTAKSQSQMLRTCRNQCRTQWDRETQEGRCLDRSIALISNLNGLQIGGTPRFIEILGVTARSKQSTITMKSSTLDRFENIVIVGSEIERQDASFEMRYKTHKIASVRSRSDGRDAPRQFQSRPS